MGRQIERGCYGGREKGLEQSLEVRSLKLFIELLCFS